MEKYCLNLVLSWNTLDPPSMVFESFSGYSILGCHFCSFIVCMTSAEDYLAFRVSVKKSGIILIGLPLYVTLPFSLIAFNILAFFVHLVF